MSAVLERSRRATAGKRMSSFTGEELQQDETFWGHETWAEDESGNESFHSSDEDSELKRDEFDSDFDDSESDKEEEEAEAGQDAEREIQRRERDEARQLSSRSYVEAARAKIGLVIPKRGRGAKAGGKRIMGDGLNAGIVLNIPPAFSGSSPPVSHLPAASMPIPVPAPLIPTSGAEMKTAKIANITAASLRPARQAIRVGRQAKLRGKAKTTESSATSTPGPKVGLSGKRKRRRYTQEELLLEAVNVTEAENERWLLARKRLQAESEKDKESANRDVRGKLIEKFVSRRGCLNTINFPDMDYIPPILSRMREKPIARDPILCAITGKPAKYRDPKTGMGYYDVAAFKELRRRYEERLPLEEYSRIDAQMTWPMGVAESKSTRSALSTLDSTAHTGSLSNQPFDSEQNFSMASLQQNSTAVTESRQTEARNGSTHTSGKIRATKEPKAKTKRAVGRSKISAEGEGIALNPEPCLSSSGIYHSNTNSYMSSIALGDAPSFNQGEREIFHHSTIANPAYTDDLVRTFTTANVALSFDGSLATENTTRAPMPILVPSTAIPFHPDSTDSVPHVNEKLEMGACAPASSDSGISHLQKAAVSSIPLLPRSNELLSHCVHPCTVSLLGLDVSRTQSSTAESRSLDQVEAIHSNLTNRGDGPDATTLSHVASFTNEEKANASDVELSVLASPPESTTHSTPNIVENLAEGHRGHVAGHMQRMNSLSKLSQEGNMSPSSPTSRRSPRQRKPSLKLLETIESGENAMLYLPSPTSPIISASEGSPISKSSLNPSTVSFQLGKCRTKFKNDKDPAPKI